MPKVLMGEDAAVAMRLAGALFEEADLEVDAVTDGRALLEKVNARRSEYDLVVLGHDLPEIDGPSCVAFLKKMFQRLPVMVLVEDKSEEVVRNLADLGIRDLQILPRSTESGEFVIRVQAELKRILGSGP